MKKIRWVLIGCGKVVLKNKKTPFINRNNTIIAICTTSIDHSLKAKEKLKLKNCNCYDNINLLLKEELFDAIYICTPPKYHYYYLKILASKNVPLIYVEKPFVLNRKQALKVLNMYKESTTQIIVAHYKRLLPKIQQLKKILINRKIGLPYKIVGIYNRKLNLELINQSWIYKKDISGGGRFFDISPHILDILYYLFGPLEKIQSKTFYDSYYHNCESKVFTNFFVDNIPCRLQFILDNDKDTDLLYIYCENGFIKTSINRNLPILIYNNRGLLLKKIYFKNPKIWGIEYVRKIDLFLKKGIMNPELANLKDAFLIQTYIDKILKESQIQ